MASNGHPSTLIPGNMRPKEELRAQLIRANEASQLSRRKAKEIRRIANIMLEMKLTTKQESLKTIIRALGLCDEEQMTQKVGILATLIVKAQKGDIKAAKYIFEVAGFDPTLALKEAQMDYIEQHQVMPNGVDVIDAEHNDENDVVIYMPAIDEEKEVVVEATESGDTVADNS